MTLLNGYRIANAHFLKGIHNKIMFVISRNFDRFQSEIVRTNRLQLKLYERENLRSDLSYACSKSEIWLQFKRFLDRSFIEMTLLRHCIHTETCIVSHAMWLLSTKTYVFLIYNTNFEKIQKKTCQLHAGFDCAVVVAESTYWHNELRSRWFEYNVSGKDQ